MQATESDVFHTQVGNRLRLELIGENLESLEQVRVFSGFEKILEINRLEAPLVVTMNEPGRHTVNVELIHSGGISDSARVECIVE